MLVKVMGIEFTIQFPVIARQMTTVEFALCIGRMKRQLLPTNGISLTSGVEKIMEREFFGIYQTAVKVHQTLLQRLVRN
jgi:hypothetical protein